MNTDVITSTYYNDLFVPEVERVDLHVRGLTVNLNKSRLAKEKKKKFNKEKIENDVESVAEVKKILNNINLDLEKGYFRVFRVW